jgi:hypothetical protein
MLAAQMAAVHEAIMTFTRRLAYVESIPQQDGAERALNKLARTFASQMEALQRYRNGGEQKVMVHQVSVNQGGQAIVGNVTRTQNETNQKLPEEQPLLAYQPRTSMAIIDREGETTPISIEQIKAQKARSPNEWKSSAQHRSDADKSTLWSAYQGRRAAQISCGHRRYALPNAWRWCWIRCPPRQ